MTFADKAQTADAPAGDALRKSASPAAGATRLSERQPTPVRPQTSIIKVPTPIAKRAASPAKRGESPLPSLNWGFTAPTDRPKVDADQQTTVVKSLDDKRPKKGSRSRSPGGKRGSKGKGAGKGQFRGRSKGGAKGFGRGGNPKGGGRQDRSSSQKRNGSAGARKDGGARAARSKS